MFFVDENGTVHEGPAADAALKAHEARVASAKRAAEAQAVAARPKGFVPLAPQLERLWRRKFSALPMAIKDRLGLTEGAIWDGLSEARRRGFVERLDYEADPSNEVELAADWRQMVRRGEIDDEIRVHNSLSAVSSLDHVTKRAEIARLEQELGRLDQESRPQLRTADEARVRAALDPESPASDEKPSRTSATPQVMTEPHRATPVASPEWQSGPAMSTDDVCTAFADVGGRSSLRWKVALKRQSEKWLMRRRCDPGTPGNARKQATWWPLGIAQALLGRETRMAVTAAELDAAFRRPALNHLREHWQAMRQDHPEWGD